MYTHTPCPGPALRLPRGIQPPAITLHLSTRLPEVLHKPGAITLVVDLVLGLIRPNAVAVQILQQLGLPIMGPQSADGLRAASSALQSGDLIGPLIDKETLGFTPVLAAQSYIEPVLDKIFASGENYRVILLPPSDGQIGEENDYFLQFFAQQAAGRVEVLAVCDERFSPSLIWQVSQVTGSARDQSATNSNSCSAIYITPGIISGEDIARLRVNPAAAGLIPLREGFWLVPPERRPIEPPEVDTLALVGSLPDPWTKADTMVRLKQRQAISLLVKLGWAAIAEGGQRVGLGLFEAAKSMAADPITTAQLDSMILGTMIGLEEYATVADAPMPAMSLPPRLRGQLLQHKAWGCAMSRRLEEAQTLFSTVRALYGEHTVPTREFLYLLNITAFTHFRRNDLETAFRLEQQMSDGIARLPRHDHHLEYINCMNTGRLHLLRGDPQEAERYFERANRTNNGLRTLADQLTVNVYRARIAEMKNDAPSIRRYWLRAGLFWAAHPLPESLSARAARLLLGQVLPARCLWTTQISKLLLARLADLFPVARDVSADGSPTICNSDWSSHASQVELIGSPDASVIMSGQSCPPVRDDLDHRVLRSALRKILAAQFQSPTLAAAPTLYLDDQYGTELPGTAEEAAGIALRLDLERATFNGELVYERGDTTSQELVAQLAPAVDSVTAIASGRATVTFRRYRSPQSLEGPSASIVQALSQGERDIARLAKGADSSSAETLQILRLLEKERIVDVGLRLGSRLTSSHAFNQQKRSTLELVAV